MWMKKFLRKGNKMKKILIIMILGLGMNCLEIEANLAGNTSVFRCENIEVVCYIYSRLTAMGDGHGAGMSCKFKEVK